jgi:hypothetical protein
MERAHLIVTVDIVTSCVIHADIYSAPAAPSTAR